MKKRNKRTGQHGNCCPAAFFQEEFRPRGNTWPQRTEESAVLMKGTPRRGVYGFTVSA